MHTPLSAREIFSDEVMSPDLFLVDAKGTMLLWEIEELEKADDSHLHSIHLGQFTFTSDREEEALGSLALAAEEVFIKI